jgi:HEAT repeat protein
MNSQVAYLGTSITDWMAALSSSDPLLRRLGAFALGEIGPAAHEAIPDLSAALRDPVPFVRVWAAAALARVAPSGGESVAVLVMELGDELGFVRSLAAWHLGRLSSDFPGIEQVLISLRQLEDDKDPSVRVEAALAVARLEGKGAPPPELMSLSWEETGRPPSAQAEWSDPRIRRKGFT